MDSEMLERKVVQPISTNELKRRWGRARDVMKENQIDFLIIQNNNDYLGGNVKWFTDLSAVHAYPMTVIFPASDGMTTITHGSSDPAKAGPPGWLLRGVKKRISTPIMLSLNYTCIYDAEKVVGELKNYKNLRICLINEGGMTAGFSSYIRNHLASVTFVDITDEIDRIKAVKSAEEIERIKESAHIHDEAMKACKDTIKPGVKEFEVAAAGRHKCKMLGSEQGFILIGSSPAGKPTPFNHIHAMNRELQEGDQIAILIEVNDAAGYYTHLLRTFCIGSIPEDLEIQFILAKEAQQLNLNMVKPSVDPLDMLEATNEFLRTRGYPEETRLYAHGQGYDLVERPSFQPGETMKLAAGMNIAIHPGVVSSKASGLICDNYIVTETGVSECLHKTPKQIFVV